MRSSPVRRSAYCLSAVLLASCWVLAPAAAVARSHEADVQRRIEQLQRELARYRSSLAGSRELLREIQSQPNSPDAAEAERVTLDAIKSDEAAIRAAEQSLTRLEAKLKAVTPVRVNTPGERPESYLTQHRRQGERPPGETQHIYDLARAGHTRTIGEPDKYRGFFHRQNGNTCAIVSQELALLRRGVRVDEDMLRRYAVAKGYFTIDDIRCGAQVCRVEYDEPTRSFSLVAPDGRRRQIAAADEQSLVWNRGGTSLGSLGDLLVDLARVPVRKSVEYGYKTAIEHWGVRGAAAHMERLERQELPARRQELVEALRTGQDAFITVDAGELWGEAWARQGLHTIAVAAVEVDKRDNSVLGYYVYDSGSGEENRLVPRRALEMAWLNDNLHLVHTR